MPIRSLTLQWGRKPSTYYWPVAAMVHFEVSFWVPLFGSPCCSPCRPVSPARPKMPRHQCTLRVAVQCCARRPARIMATGSQAGQGGLVTGLFTSKLSMQSTSCVAFRSAGRPPPVGGVRGQAPPPQPEQAPAQDLPTTNPGHHPFGSPPRGGCWPGSQVRIWNHEPTRSMTCHAPCFLSRVALFPSGM